MLSLTCQLFFAIRGGGSNFGIVTEFQLALHSIPPVCWSGGLLYTLDKLEAVVEAGLRWKKEVMTVDDLILLGLTQSPQDGSQANHPLPRMNKANGDSGDYRHLCPYRSR